MRNRRAKGNQRKPQFAGFFGKTGSGKSHALWEKFLEWQADEKRQALVWSPKEFDAHGHPLDDYAGRLNCRACRNIQDFVKEASKGKDVVFVPSMNRKHDEEDFGIFNRLAMALTPCRIIVDELHTVTRATGGVPAWHISTTTGRASGLSVLGSSQRPAHVDKDFFNALTYAWCGAQNFEEDAKVTARLVLAKASDILLLSGHNHLSREM